MNTGPSIVGVIFLLFSLLVFAFWVWMLIDCLTSKHLQGTNKVLWFLVIFFLSGLGALIYFFVGRKKEAV